VCAGILIEEQNEMKQFLGLLSILIFMGAAPPLKAQEHSDHIEVGVFADYFRFHHASPERNFVGIGGRAAFAVRPSIQIEAEMAYDFPILP